MVHTADIARRSPADAPSGRPPGLDSSRWRRLIRAAEAEAAGFRRQLRSCRKQPKMEPVHDLRVSARRLLVWCDWLLWLGKDQQASKIRVRIKRLFRRLAQLRDRQVQRNSLKRAPATLRPISVRCERWLRREEGREVERVRRYCRDFNAQRLARSISRSLRRAAKRSRQDKSGKDPVDRWVQLLAHQVERSQASVSADRPESLHRLRIAVKHLRYAVESLPATGSSSPGRPLAQLRKLQSDLGRIQDAEVMLAWLKDAAKDHPRRESVIARLAQWVDRQRVARIRRFVAACRPTKAELPSANRAPRRSKAVEPALR